MPKAIDEKGFIDTCKIPIEQGLAKLFLKESQSSNKEWAERKARSSLFLERNAKTTVNNTLLFGTQHRPDMLVKHGSDYRIAIEFKVAQSGDEVRAALGQCLVYASEYEFTIALVLDATSTGKIKRAYDKGAEYSRPEGHLEVNTHDAIFCIGHFEHLQYHDGKQDAAHTCHKR